MSGPDIPMARFAGGGYEIGGATVETFVKISQFRLVAGAGPDTSMQRRWLAVDTTVAGTRTAAIATARVGTATAVQVTCIGQTCQG